MPTIKIVPMPGKEVQGPVGPQGPRGYQGDTGLTGPAGADADLGYLTITSETDPQEGDLTTLEAPGNIVIQSPTAPGLITLQSYLGVQVNTHPTAGGIHINGTDLAHKVVTHADLPTGATGSFVSHDNKTVTVVNGIITAITGA